METTNENTNPGEPTIEGPTVTEVPNGEPAPGEAPSAKKKVWIGIVLLAAVLVLAGAAFLGARLLAPSETANRPMGGGPKISMKGAGGGSAAVEANLNIQNAPEIPQRAPEMNGAVTEIKDNSLLVSDVKSVMMRVDETGQSDMDIEYQGTTTEVVVTKETQTYLDTTFQDFSPEKKMPKDGEVIQQTIEPSSFSAIGTQSMLSVWGYKRGDRLMAEVILVNQMMGGSTK